jgi:hypothetical protein
MKTNLNSPQGTAGNTLLVTIVIVAILGFLLATYMTLTQNQNRATMRSQAWNLSMALVEAGIEEAMAHLNVNGSNSIHKDGWVKTGETSYNMSRWLGYNSYYTVTITNFQPGYSNSLPFIISRGYVPLVTAVAAAPGPVFADFSGNPNTPYIGRGIRAQMAVDRLFARGIVAKDIIDLNGNNIATDSYDSTDPRYSTNGIYDILFRRANGDIASNASITNAINIGNANIRGHVAVGPRGTISLGPNGTVGDLDWVAAGNVGIQPGYFANDMNMSFPDVKVPFTGGYMTPTKFNPPVGITNILTTVITNGVSTVQSIAYPTGSPVSIVTNTGYQATYPTGSPGPIVTNKAGNKIKGYYYPVFTATYTGTFTNTTVTVSEAKYDWVILDDGNYQLTRFDGSVYVGAKAVVYVTEVLEIDALTIEPGKSLDLYSSAPSVALAGNNTLNTDGRPNSFHFWGLPTCTSVTFSGNAGFTGTIYAPQAALTLNGGGNNTVDFSGASVTKTVTLNGHFNFHYDESLGRFGPARGYYVVNWEELNPEEVPLVKLW